MPVSAAILDMDGLMVDTEPLYKFAWQQAALELGYVVDDELYAQCVGLHTLACEALIVERHGAAFPLSQFRELWPDVWQRQVDQGGIQTKLGLDGLLEFIKRHGLPVAVATSSDATFVERTLRAAGLTGRFNAIVSGDEVARGKPEPDIYLEAARRLGVSPGDCVAFEDSEAGILAVNRAGMRGVLVPHWPASSQARQAAFRIVETLHQGREVLADLIDGTLR